MSGGQTRLADILHSGGDLEFSAVKADPIAHAPIAPPATSESITAAVDQFVTALHQAGSLDSGGFSAIDNWLYDTLQVQLCQLPFTAAKQLAEYNATLRIQEYAIVRTSKRIEILVGEFNEAARSVTECRNILLGQEVTGLEERVIREYQVPAYSADHPAWRWLTEQRDVTSRDPGRVLRFVRTESRQCD